MTRRRTGQLVALMLAAVVVVLIIIGTRGGSPATPPPDTSNVPEDLASRQDDERTASDPMHDSAIQRIDNLALTRVDPETGRLETRLAWEALEPESDGLVTLQHPEAWIYDRASLLHIRAVSGRLVWLSREEEELPESGDLVGEVRIRVYELDPDWTGDPSQERDENGDLRAPLVASIDTDAMHFESALGEVTTQDDLTVEASGVLFEGRGLVLRISEVALMQGIERRLQYLRIDEGRRLVIRPEAEEPAALKSEASGQGKGEGSGADGESGAGSVVLYHMTIDGDVHLGRGDQTIRSEHVDAYARLVDRQLPRDAIASLPRGADPAKSGAASGSGGGGAGGTGGGDDGPIELNWSGPLEIRTLREVPEALRLDDVAVSFSSPVGNEVFFADTALDFTGRVVGLRYGLTSQRLALLGVGGQGVELQVPQGDLITGRADIDLKNGEGRFTGPGTLRSADMAPAPAGATFQRPRPLQSAVWSDGAVFHFAFDDSGAVVPSDVKLDGAVELRDADRLVGGDTVIANFVQADGAAPDEEPWLALSRVEVDGRALVASGDRDGVSGQHIVADFALPAEAGGIGDMQAVAEGNVRARSGDNEIFTEVLELDAS
ncbi:MAG: hypothetical protein KDA21_11290, partial [Phycisphaerales bacterium]|nr:hypothetical protein [Phycisphaerales bacterium]